MDCQDDGESEKIGDSVSVTEQSPLAEVLSPVTLPCSGRIMPNRLAKVALYEHLASFRGGLPNSAHQGLYSRWGLGKWGMVMTGNVQVIQDHISLGRDMIIPAVLTAESINAYERLAASIHHGNSIAGAPHKDGQTLAIIQLSHAGRQSPNVIGGRRPFVPPLAPSAVPLDFVPHGRGSSAGFGYLATNAFSSLMHYLMFQTPREMTRADIEVVIDAFVRGAQLAARSGFDGVEIHGGHGYLLAEFLSPKANIRTDEFGVSNPLHFLWRIVSAIRAPDAVPSDFVLGVKLNAADYVDSSAVDKESADVADERRVLAHVREIASWKKIDFIEISGGTYENPKFVNISRRQALFSRFSRRALAELTQTEDSSRPLVMLTGGLTTPDLFASALKEKHADLLGIGRLGVLHPELPKLLEKDLISGSDGQTSFTDVLKNGPLASGIEPWEDLPADQPLPWIMRIERALTSLLSALWAHIPASVRPEFPRLIGAGVEVAWYEVAMRKLATRSVPSTAEIGDGLGGLIRMWIYVAPGSPQGGHRTLLTFLGGAAIVIASLLLGRT